MYQAGSARCYLERNGSKYIFLPYLKRDDLKLLTLFISNGPYTQTISCFINNASKIIRIWINPNHTANIYSFLLCPVSTVVSLYSLHLIPYPVQGRSYSKKTVISFTIIPLYLEQQLNVNHTVKLQWKVGHN